jgi:hypothetical protein
LRKERDMTNEEKLAMFEEALKAIANKPEKENA